MLKSGVYRIDLGNGWFYVGSACNLKRREAEHRSDMRRGVHGTRIVQRVFNKYGAFTFTILGRYPVDEIIEREQDLLDEHCKDDKCANIALVAGPSMLGRKMPPRTPEWCAAQSAAMTGRKASDETRAKMSASGLGRKKPPRTPEWSSAQSAAKTGKKASDKARANMSAAQMGHLVSDSTRSKMRASMARYWARRRLAESAP